MLKRKTGWLMVVLLMLVLVLAACGNENKDDDSVDVVNIDAGQLLPILAKEKGFYDEEFEKIGVKVNYTSLTSASEMLEGITSNNLDFALTGYIGVIIGQASDVPFYSIAEGTSGGGDGILVNADSKLSSIKDLKGKKVAVTKSSSSWGLLLRALDKEGLSINDIEIINLPPNDAQSALLSGQVDAWGIWEPYRSTLVESGEAKLLETDLPSVPGIIIARDQIVNNHPEFVEAYLAAQKKAVNWLEENYDEGVSIIAKAKGIDEDTVRISLENSPPVAQKISDESIEKLQSVADVLSKLNQINTEVEIEKSIKNSLE